MSSAAAHAFNSIGIGLGIVGLVTAALLFAVQSRSYRRTHHPSLELLQLASAAAFGYGGLSFVARWLWPRSPGAALAVYSIAAVVALAHVALGVTGMIKSLRAFELHVAGFQGSGPNNSSKPTPLRGAA